MVAVKSQWKQATLWPRARAILVAAIVVGAWILFAVPGYKLIGASG